MLADAVAVSRQLTQAGVPSYKLAAYLDEITSRAVTLTDDRLLTSLLTRVDLLDGAISVSLDLSAMLKTSIPSADGQPIIMTQTHSIQMKRRGVEMRLVLNSAPVRPSQVDPVLVKTIARAHAWWDDLLTGRANGLRDLAEREGLSKSYVGDVIKLAFLAPQIVEAIVSGHQPAELVADHLLKATDLPIDWQAQKAHLGFA